MKIALITGVTGQDGAYLADLLLSKDYEGDRCPPVDVSIYNNGNIRRRRFNE